MKLVAGVILSAAERRAIGVYQVRYPKQQEIGLRLRLRRQRAGRDAPAQHGQHRPAQPGGIRAKAGLGHEGLLADDAGEPARSR